MKLLRKLILDVVIVLLLIGLLLVVNQISAFRAAASRALISTAFGELIGRVYLDKPQNEGLISIPVDCSVFGNSPAGQRFCAAVNNVKGRELNYCVFPNKPKKTYVVTDDKARIIANGFLPTDFITEPIRQSP